jgi:hypothetical protein
MPQLAWWAIVILMLLNGLGLVWVVFITQQIHVAVNSERTAMLGVIKNLRDEILKLTVDKIQQHETDLRAIQEKT